MYKLLPTRKHLQLVGVSLVIMLCLVMPSIAATGTVTVPDRVAFTTTDSMDDERYIHTATLLDDGKVLVAGGCCAASHLVSAELYDPTTGTWSTTGSMNDFRWFHTATLLGNGKVLVAGGLGGDPITRLTSAELYDPTTGTWSITDSMNDARVQHTATLLDNGKVLVAGGYNSGALISAELYDPSTGTWSPTGDMNDAVHWNHTATLLGNGQVLVTGGRWPDFIESISAELYNTTTGMWSTTGSMSDGRQSHTATLLNDGKVLVVGGIGSGGYNTSAELYDPTTGTWGVTGSMNDGHSSHTATLLNNGQVLVAGGTDDYLTGAELYDPTTSTWSTGSMNDVRYHHTAILLNSGKVLVIGGNYVSTLASAELGTFMPGNTFTGTLLLPSNWLSNTIISTQFAGSTSDAAISTGALSNDNTSWGSWITASSELTTVTWDAGNEGKDRPVYLRLRDVNGQVATVVTGTVNVDLSNPIATITALPALSPDTVIPLSWSGSDTLSGVASYDVQYLNDVWTDWLTNTTSISASFTGKDGQTYDFRVRSRDLVGNVSDYSYTQTTVDITPPTGSLVINGGALSTSSVNVTLSLSSIDATSNVVNAELSNDGLTYSGWQTYIPTANWTLTNGDGVKAVYVRFKDAAGNVSLPISDTIILDTAAGNEYGVTIKEGSLFTNQTAVTLTISAKPGTTQIQVSNDGGFAGAEWESYTSRKMWTITQYGNYVIPRVVYVKYKDADGNVSATFQDDIILDVTAPTGTVNISSALGTLDTSVTLNFNAVDDVSGVGEMLVSNRPDFVGASWQAYADTLSWVLGSDTVYVRYRDNAGNVSEVYSASLTPTPTPMPSVFLPMILK